MVSVIYDPLWIRNRQYERKSEATALSRAFGELGFPDAMVVMGPVTGLQRILSSAHARARNRAAREGSPLPQLTEQANFLNSDIIIADMGDPDLQERGSLPVRCALFEASVTAGQEDVERAAARAESLSRIMGVPVIAGVIAATVPSPQEAQAQAAGVRLFITPEE